MTRQRIHRTIYIVLLCLLAGSITTSNFMMNLAWALLLVNWVAEWNWKEKFKDFRSNRLLHAFLLLFAIHLVGLLWTSNFDYAFNDIRVKLPLLAVPLVVLTTKRLEAKEMHTVLGFYIATLFVVCVIAFVRYITIPNLPYRQLVPFISHIRFSLNLCLGTALIFYNLVHHPRPISSKLIEISIIWLVTAEEALSLLQSYTAFAVLAVLVVVTLIVYWNHIPSKTTRWVAASCLASALVAALLVIGSLSRDYYRMVPLSQQPLAAATQNGRPYIHKQDGLIENGNYVNNYICREELESGWMALTGTSIDDTTPNGYSVYSTLLRYLNALGTTKDSVGLTLLNANDIANIQQGIANPVYCDASKVRKMVYVMLFERENYVHFHAVKNFTMLQRFELWRNGWQVFLQHPIFGTGTGDVVDACHAQLQQNDSPLTDTTKHTHNQYLTFAITFGIVGFILIFGAFIYAFRKQRLLTYFPTLAITTITLISFLTEDTLETAAGTLLVTLFLSLFSQVSTVHCPFQLPNDQR